MIKKIHTENREEWKALRHNYIGGSDAAAIVGLNKFSSAYSVWAEKTDRVPAFEGNLATEVGTYLEEFVAKKFAEETGKQVRRCNLSMVNDLYPWAIANVDRLIVGEDAGLEIKTTSDLNTKSFKGGEYPANYYVQSMHYMAVTGRSRWYLAVLIGNHDFKTFTIERDEDEIIALMDAERDFWTHVQNNTPPAPDGSEATTDTIKALYPDSTDEGGPISLFGAEDAARSFLDLNQQIKDLETLRDEQANRIKALMGESERAVSDLFKVSWKTSPRRTFDAKRWQADHPEFDYNAYFNLTTQRRFTVKEA